MKPWLFIAFQLFSFVCFSQNEHYRTDSIRITSTSTTVWDLNDLAAPQVSTKLPFSDLHFHESRLDTSCIGVIGKPLKRVNVKGGLSAGLEKYLKSALQSNFDSSSYTLQCFVKKLRISMYDSIAKVARENNNMYLVVTELECYYEINNHYYPAFRLDSSYVVPAIDVDKKVEILDVLLQAITSKLLRLNSERILKRNSYSLPDIVDRYSERFKTGFSNSIPQKGLYRSFYSFKNNKPEINDFKVTYKKGDFIFKNNSDSVIKPTEILIYSDGYRLWINNYGNFYPLIRKGNRFEYLGVINTNSRSNRFDATSLPLYYPLNSPMNIPTIATGLLMAEAQSGGPAPTTTIHYLDMETGEIY